MSKNVIFIKDLGVLESLNNYKNTPNECYIDFKGETNLNSFLTFCCAQFNNSEYVPTIFPKIELTNGLLNYGVLDFSSSHNDFINLNPITKLSQDKTLTLAAPNNTSSGLYHTINLSIDKLNHLSTNEEKKILRIRYMPLEKNNFHDGFYASANINSLYSQDVLLRKDVISENNNIVFKPTYGDIYLELSFYLYEKVTNSLFSFYKSNTSSTWITDFSSNSILVLQNSFITKNKLALYNQGLGAVSNNIQIEKLSSNLSKTGEYIPTSSIVAIDEDNNSFNCLQLNLSNYNLYSLAEISSTTLGNGSNNIDIKQAIVCFSGVYSGFAIVPENHHGLKYTPNLEQYITSQILFLEDNINIINSSKVGDKGELIINTKGQTNIKGLPYIYENRLSIGEINSQKSNNPLNYVIHFTGAPNQGDNLGHFLVQLTPTSTDKEILNCLQTFYDIECRLEEKIEGDSITYTLLEKRNGFGNLIFLSNGNLDVENSTGQTFYNLSPNINKYRVSYLFKLKTYKLYN